MTRPQLRLAFSNSNKSTPTSNTATQNSKLTSLPRAESLRTLPRMSEESMSAARKLDRLRVVHPVGAAAIERLIDSYLRDYAHPNRRNK